MTSPSVSSSLLLVFGMLGRCRRRALCPYLRRPRRPLGHRPLELGLGYPLLRLPEERVFRSVLLLAMVVD